MRPVFVSKALGSETRMLENKFLELMKGERLPLLTLCSDLVF